MDAMDRTARSPRCGRVGSLLTLAAAMLLPTSALAEPDSGHPDYGRPGFFIGAGMAVGVATKLQDDAEDLLGEDARIDAAVGFNFRAGYRIIPWLATEIEFEGISGFDVKLLGNEKVTDARTMLASGNVKGYLIPNGRFQPYLLGGVGYYRTKVESVLPAVALDGVAGRLGGGFDAYLTENWLLAFDVQYILPGGDAKDLDYVSIGFGAQYRF